MYKTTYDKSILKEVDKWIKKYYSLELDQFRVDKNFLMLTILKVTKN